VIQRRLRHTIRKAGPPSTFGIDWASSHLPRPIKMTRVTNQHNNAHRALKRSKRSSSFRGWCRAGGLHGGRRYRRRRREDGHVLLSRRLTTLRCMIQASKQSGFGRIRNWRKAAHSCRPRDVSRTPQQIAVAGFLASTKQPTVIQSRRTGTGARQRLDPSWTF